MPRPRNIVWITTDHMRYDCVGANGNPAMHTPNLDALAEGGVRFADCYANNFVCMPSRCSFMTGCYPEQTGVMQNGQELPDDFPWTAPRVFGAGGYRTVQIGKLHFQGHEDMDLDPRPRNTYGFDVFQLSEEPGCYEDAYRTWLRGEHPELVDAFTVPRPMSQDRRKERTQFQVLDAPWEASHSGWVATQACRYLGAWGVRREPQFMHLGFYAPHPPLNPTREMAAPYEGVELPELARREDDWNDPGDLPQETLEAYRRHFYAMVTGVDMAVGRVCDELRRIGQLEDTLIVFGSDHGDHCGDHGRIAKGPTYYESVMHMPWILHWPNGFPQGGRRIDGLVEMVDILPTLCELAGISPPAAMQGRSYAQSLLSGAPITPRSDVYGTGLGGKIMLRTPERKYLRYHGDRRNPEVLYDLVQDPGEFRNVAGDAAYADELPALRERALERVLEASSSIRQRRVRF